MRTSESDPLQIAEITAPAGGRIGITFCPGKHQRDARSGQWARDLCVDVDAIKDWGADVVVTLVTEDELRSLRVTRLGDEVQARGMRWLHLPIEDVSLPSNDWEEAWGTGRAALHEVLDRNGRVLVHCKGGLGRAGTVAARLLMERGDPAVAAIQKVRAVRSNSAIEGPQEPYLHRIGASAGGSAPHEMVRLLRWKTSPAATQS